MLHLKRLGYLVGRKDIPKWTEVLWEMALSKWVDMYRFAGETRASVRVLSTV